MLTVLSVSVVLVTVCVGIHYQALVLLSTLRQRDRLRRRSLLNLLVLGALVAHVIEVSCFSAAYAALDNWGGYGELHGVTGTAGGQTDAVSNDYWYFSFVAYTSLGFGDITPRGSLRFMTALETLTGLVLIAWTASFIFLEMQAMWHADERDGQMS
ncbi:MAG: ion channel [Planctomycetaceae bacterium]